MTKVYSKDGEDSGETELPGVFDTTYRSDLIRRAFHASQANEKQPYGADEYAGLRTSAESRGSGQGIAHIARIKGGNRAARAPQAVGGRPAHPPKAEKKVGEGINVKERKKAIRSAVAATTDPELVAERGHEFGEVELPVVVDSGFEDLVKTREVVEALEEIGIHRDVERADEGRSIRSGRGKTRGRKYKQPRSVLFVATEELKAARNLAGVDVVRATDLGVKHLAPGGNPGRLTVWTESALEVLEE